MIRNLVFDIGGVLLRFEHRRFFDTLRNACGVQSHKIQEAHEQAMADYYRGLINSEDFVRQFNANAASALGADDYSKLLFSHFTLNKPLIKMITDRLSGRFAVYFLSNLSEQGVEFLENARVDSIAEQAFFSCNFRTLKPEEQLYRIMLEQTAAAPEETVFIDNNQANLEPAIRLGMQTILFKDNNQLESDLRKLAHF